MSRPPKPVLDYLVQRAVLDRAPAYLFANRRGQLIFFGGDLERYRIQGLEVGLDVTSQVAFLCALLPVDAEVRIPCVETYPGVYQDIHLLPEPEGDWVILLDAAPEAARRKRLLQVLRKVQMDEQR